MIENWKKKIADWKLQFILKRASRLTERESRAVFWRLLPDLNEQENRTVVLKLLEGKEIQVLDNPVDHDRVANFSAYDRDAWVEKKINAIPAGARVLDAGAGQGRYKNLLKHTQYEAQDFAQYEGSVAGPLQEVWEYSPLNYVCDITSIPVESGSFDAVLCTEVLEHVPEPIKALAELSRLLKIGGSLILSVPLGSGVHQEPYYFYGGFSPYFFKHHFSQMGLEIEEIVPLGGLLKHAAQELARVGRLIGEHQAANSHFEYLVKDWIPQQLQTLDSKYFIEQFTVGYLVKAKKVSA